jgi:hypothetical protein
MSDEPIEQLEPKLLSEVNRRSWERDYDADCKFRALVHMLVDRKVLKSDEDAIFRELELRAEGLKWEDQKEAYIEARARTLREAWDKLPTQ